MGKNKRYKRLAKRIMGECFQRKMVCNEDCKYMVECYCTPHIPIPRNLRENERWLKYEK